MGAAAYNRGSRLIREQLDREAKERRHCAPVQRCLCGASIPGGWTAGHHHGLHRCAQIITR